LQNNLEEKVKKKELQLFYAKNVKHEGANIPATKQRRKKLF